MRKKVEALLTTNNKFEIRRKVIKARCQVGAGKPNRIFELWYYSRCSVQPLFLTKFLMAFMLSLGAVSGHAKVDSQSKQHFVVSNELIFSMNAKQVWKHLVKVEQWWDGKHSFSGDAKNLYLDIHQQYCFCEKWLDGWVEHLKVVSVIQNSKLTFRGGLGPLQNQSINGALDINLSEDKGVTRLSWSYRVYGTVESGLDQWATAVDGVLEAQFSRLKSLTEAKSL